MKTKRLTFIMAVLISLCCVYANAQQISQSKFPGSAVNQSSNCPTCPGAPWTNLDGNDPGPAVVGLAAKPKCIQNDCHFSKKLIATNFKFNLNPGDEIVGITVEITGNASKNNAVVDSSVRLILNGMNVGGNKKKPGFWPTNVITREYGGPTDLWGTNLISTQIEDPSFGVGFMVQNASILGPQEDQYSVEFSLHISKKGVKIKVKVTVKTGFGLIETQERVAQFIIEPDINIYPNPTNDVLNISSGMELSGGEISVLNMLGQTVLKQKQTVEDFSTEKQLDVAQLQKGLYLLKINTSEGEIVEKFIKE